MIPIFAWFDFVWSSNPWFAPLIFAGLLFLIAFLVVKVVQRQRENAAAFSTAPGIAAAPPVAVRHSGNSLAPMANPKDVQRSLEALARIANLEGLTPVALCFHHLASGDQSEIHRSLREIELLLSTPRGVTQMARGIVLRHLEELKDDPEVKQIIASLASK